MVLYSCRPGGILRAGQIKQVTMILVKASLVAQHGRISLRSCFLPRLICKLILQTELTLANKFLWDASDTHTRLQTKCVLDIAQVAQPAIHFCRLGQVIIFAQRGAVQAVADGRFRRQLRCWQTGIYWHRVLLSGLYCRQGRWLL